MTSKVEYVYAFPRPSVTATITLINETTRKVLCGKRKDKIGEKHAAYPGFMCVPGGFMDPMVEVRDVLVIPQGGGMHFRDNDVEAIPADHARPGETVEQTAMREVQEETGLVITEDRLRLYHVHSDPKTDPRCHVVNVCYYVSITDEEAKSAVAGDDLETLEELSELEIKRMEMAFNHKDLALRAIHAAREENLNNLARASR